MLVYGRSGNGMKALWGSADMGQGPGAVSWLIGDVNGDGKAEICRQWANGKSLGILVYGWSGNGMKALWYSPNMGHGPDAVSWLIGDVNGDRMPELCQQWANGDSLGMILYEMIRGVSSLRAEIVAVGQPETAGPEGDPVALQISFSGV